MKGQKNKKTESQAGRPGRLGAQKLALRVLSTEGWPSLGYCTENRLTVTAQLQTLLSH